MMDSVDSIMNRLVSRQKRESPYNNRLQRTVEERLPRSKITALLTDTVKLVFAIVTVTESVQEKMFIVFRPSLADTLQTRALKFMSKFMFTKVTEVDS